MALTDLVMKLSNVTTHVVSNILQVLIQIRLKNRLTDISSGIILNLPFTVSGIESDVVSILHLV